MDKIIGGQTRCGFGWNMLMDCLSEGSKTIYQHTLFQHTLVTHPINTSYQHSCLSTDAYGPPTRPLTYPL